MSLIITANTKERYGIWRIKIIDADKEEKVIIFGEICAYFTILNPEEEHSFGQQKDMELDYEKGDLIKYYKAKKEISTIENIKEIYNRE